MYMYVYGYVCPGEPGPGPVFIKDSLGANAGYV